MEPEFKANQVQVVKNAKAMVEVFLNRGYKVVSGGTENHLFWWIWSIKTSPVKMRMRHWAVQTSLSTKQCAERSEEPVCDLRYPCRFLAITRRGFKEAEARELAGWMCDVLDNLNDEATIEAVKQKFWLSARNIRFTHNRVTNLM